MGFFINTTGFRHQGFEYTSSLSRPLEEFCILDPGMRVPKNKWSPDSTPGLLNPWCETSGDVNSEPFSHSYSRIFKKGTEEALTA